MIAGDYSPQARLAQHLKDVRLIREFARRHDARTPLSDTHEALLQIAVDLGGGMKLEFVLIPAGKFTMGCETQKAAKEERPAQ